MAGLAAAVTAAATAVAVPSAHTPARAADTVTCGSSAAVFAVTSTGTLRHYPVTAPGTSTSVYQGSTTIGVSGWTTFGKVLAGPNHRVYGINSSGLARYRWLGSGSNWELVDGKQAWRISTGFTEYASGTLKNKITVDEIGDFYTVDAAGRLNWHRFDEAAKTWAFTDRTLDTGWDQYDLIVAAGVGVLYARRPDGTLHRYRFDPVSQRWIDRARQVGTGWQMFTKGVFSAGGDTLWGIRADGILNQYRLREDTWAWAVHRTTANTGWGGFLNVTATTDTCKLTASHTPARPSTPTRTNTAVAVLQAPASGTALGTVEYAYTDNTGRLLHGRQNPDSFSSVQWAGAPGLEAYTGVPALVADSGSRIRVVAHVDSSDVRSLDQKQPGLPDWHPSLDLGGRMLSEPAVARLSDASLVVVASDGAGALWFRRQDGTTGDLRAWERLGTTTGLTGTPVLTALGDRSAAVLVRDAAGTLHVATYRDGTLGAWSSLGGTGFTDTPSVVLRPGPRLMVFARHTDGTVQVRSQASDGTWPGAWTPVGGGAVAVGSPSAVLNPVSGTVSVFVRDAQGTIQHSYETTAGGSTWREWQTASTGEVYVSDPTAFAFTNSNGAQIAYVVRTSAAVRVYQAQDPGTLGAARSTGVTAGFSQQDLPQPDQG
ncbi:tachylectin-related carbohydrate-binding protein [Micromonospora sp. NPDC049799]|uniref:tachylectin-related carbohydrate-binding protein n=1 Tax=Micromonospora sp. NPDC049799 TaxID=3154741 RepID=UPI00340969B4